MTLDSFMGIPIVATPYVPKTKRVQVRFPRSKRKRIRKKWAARPENWQEQSIVWLVNGYYTAHPEVVASIRGRVPSLPIPSELR